MDGCIHRTGTLSSSLQVLLTGMGRLRVGSVGILDALMGAEQPGPEEMQMLMRQDISVSRVGVGVSKKRYGDGELGGTIYEPGVWGRDAGRGLGLGEAAAAAAAQVRSAPQ